MFGRKRKTDPELVMISKKMDEIKASNKEAVRELEKLNKTLIDMQKRLKTMKGG